MAHVKTFLFGVFTAYTIYYFTKKGPDGKSILDELLSHPGDFMREAKGHVMADTITVIKEGLS